MKKEKGGERGVVKKEKRGGVVQDKAREGRLTWGGWCGVT
jgi:hypothetical protein